ncbi:MAG: serine/threonine protein kinase [Verrucomicrobiota bacterium]
MKRSSPPKKSSKKASKVVSDFSWGSEETLYFFELTPDRILDAVEMIGVRCTGRCLTLNSMENRVFEVEIETDQPVASPSEKSRIIKFYRPGRWSREQIQEEHQFLSDLREADIPSIAPIADASGNTIHTLPDLEIFFAVFPKQGGRHCDELQGEEWDRVGQLLARIHIVGAQHTAPHRISLDPKTYGLGSLDYLLTSEAIHPEFQKTFTEVVQAICEKSTPWFQETEKQRIHGDGHWGNLLWGSLGPAWVDFDDMINGPCVQDLWLMTAGRDEDSLHNRDLLIDGYEKMRTFDHHSWRLVEPLRALRFVHFSAWISKRWKDPAFPAKFSHFGTRQYWQDQVHDLEDVWNSMNS